MGLADTDKPTGSLLTLHLTPWETRCESRRKAVASAAVISYMEVKVFSSVFVWVFLATLADKGELSLFKYIWCKGLEAGLKQSVGIKQQFRKRKALILSDWWSRFGGKLHHLLPASTCQEKHLREVSLQCNDLIQTDAGGYFCPIKGGN